MIELLIFIPIALLFIFIPFYDFKVLELIKRNQDEMDENEHDEKWLNEDPYKRRSCYDCKHLKAHVSWWCVNEDAVKARGTNIPGCFKCPFWEVSTPKVAKRWRNTKLNVIK